MASTAVALASSSALYFSASETMRSISSCERRPLSLVMVILLLLAGGLLDGRHVEDAVGVNVEGDIDLGHAAGHRGDAVEVELAEHVVVLGHGALALEDLDEHAGLVVGVGGEGLRLLGGDGGVALDERGHHLAGGLEAERERGHVEQEQSSSLLRVGAGEDGGLDGGAVGDGLVGVDRLAGLLAVEEVGEQLLRPWGCGWSRRRGRPRAPGPWTILESRSTFSTGSMVPAEEVHAELLEAGAGDG